MWRSRRRCLARRDRPGREGKISAPLAEMPQTIEKLLVEIQQAMHDKALAFRKANTHDAKNYDELKKAVETGFALSPWCGSADCEAKIKEETRATMRCIPSRTSQVPLGQLRLLRQTSGRARDFCAGLLSLWGTPVQQSENPRQGLDTKGGAGAPHSKALRARRGRIRLRFFGVCFALLSLCASCHLLSGNIASRLFLDTFRPDVRLGILESRVGFWPVKSPRVDRHREDGWERTLLQQSQIGASRLRSADRLRRCSAAWRRHDQGHSLDRHPAVYGAFVAFKMVPAYVAEYQLADKMQEQARFAVVNRYPEEQIRDNIFKVVKDLEIPVKREDIKIIADAGRRQDRLRLHGSGRSPRLQMNLHFTPSSENKNL